MVCINDFVTDTPAEIARIREICEAEGARVAVSTHWEHGGEGALELADAVMDACNEKTDFRPLYERPFRYLVDFNEALHRLVCELLSFTPQVSVSDEYVADTAGWTDLRQSLSPKQPLASLERFRPVDYYQVFASRLGFRPNLSIGDLLFNLGPESRLILRKSFL